MSNINVSLAASSAANELLVALIKKDEAKAINLMADMGMDAESIEKLVDDVKKSIADAAFIESLSTFKEGLTDSLVDVCQEYLNGNLIPEDVNEVSIRLRITRIEKTLASGQVEKPGGYVENFSIVDKDGKSTTLSNIAKGGPTRKTSTGNGTKAGTPPPPDGYASWTPYAKEKYPNFRNMPDGTGFDGHSVPRDLEKTLKDEVFLTAKEKWLAEQPAEPVVETPEPVVETPETETKPDKKNLLKNN